MAVSISRSGTFASGHQMLDVMLRRGYTLIEDTDAPYRFVWLNRETRTVVTYCEGDLTTEVCGDDLDLNGHLAKLRAFYGALLIDPETYTVELYTIGSWSRREEAPATLIEAIAWADHSTHRNQVAVRVLDNRGRVTYQTGTRYMREHEIGGRG
jgi:hypothetical protein